MSGFKDTTKTMSGHDGSPLCKATGGTINRMAGGGHFGRMQKAAGVMPDTNNIQNGLTAHTPDMGGHAAVQRQVPSTQELAQHGGKTPLTPGYGKGGKAEKHFHVHKHYHTGGKVKTVSSHYSGNGGNMQGKTRSTETRNGGFPSGSTGGTKNRLAKGGKTFKVKKGALHKDMGIPEGKKIPRGKIRSKLAHDKAEGNTKGVKRDVFALNMGNATGGTIDKMGAGGALYGKGGRKK